MSGTRRGKVNRDKRNESCALLGKRESPSRTRAKDTVTLWVSKRKLEKSCTPRKPTLGDMMAPFISWSVFISYAMIGVQRTALTDYKLAL